MNAYLVIDELPSRIYLGKHTETGVREIRVDCSAWLDAWPDLQISAWVTAPGAAAAYPAVTTMEGSVLVWPISATDTATVGTGSVEFMGTTEGGCRKLSAAAWTLIRGSTTCTTCDPPDPAKPWVDQVLDAAERAEDAADQAEAAAVNPPIIGDNGNWYLWDFETGAYADSGKPSQGSGGGGSLSVDENGAATFTGGAFAVDENGNAVI